MVKKELWKKDGTTYVHLFASEQEAACTESWQVKPGVPCPFVVEQKAPVEDMSKEKAPARGKKKRT